MFIGPFCRELTSVIKLNSILFLNENPYNTIIQKKVQIDTIQFKYKIEPITCINDSHRKSLEQGR